MKKGVLTNFTKITVPESQACNFIKKETLAQVLSCEFCEISKNTFFTEQLWTAASELVPEMLSPSKKDSFYLL